MDGHALPAVPAVESRWVDGQGHEDTDAGDLNRLHGREIARVRCVERMGATGATGMAQWAECIASRARYRVMTFQRLMKWHVTNHRVSIPSTCAGNWRLQANKIHWKKWKSANVSLSSAWICVARCEMVQLQSGRRVSRGESHGAYRGEAGALLCTSRPLALSLERDRSDAQAVHLAETAAGAAKMCRMCITSGGGAFRRACPSWRN